MWKSNKGDMANRKSYQDYVTKFAEHGLKLLTTEDEYNAIEARPSSTWLKVVGNCGHETKYCWDAIKAKERKGQTVNAACEPCLKKVKSDATKKFLKTGDTHAGSEMEYIGVMMLQEEIKDIFELHITNDGCLADCIIKPKDSTDDEYMMIQVKTTKKLYDTTQSKFNFHGNTYTDCTIVCINIEEESFWIFDWKEVIGSHGISCGSSMKSKWDKFKTDDVCEIIVNKYLDDKTVKHTFAECMIPVGDEHRIEHEYRMIREREIPYLGYKAPDGNMRHFDFYIGTYKVQEKVAYKRKNRTNLYTAFLKKSHNGKDKCYDKGDNDFYWVWKTDRLFYIFPEYVVIEKGFVEMDGNLNGQLKCISISDDNWTKDYMYSLDDPSIKNKVTSIFDKKIEDMLSELRL